ncbi:MAG: hypothetical protein HY079_04920, partial [Elusimicrobia bacterium]|nr:hypothetical protein [Elusimicrobiota bacterium]
MIFYISALVAALSAAPASAAGADGLPPALSTSVVVPTIITLAPTVHDYTRFADGGPDANWYVGFNNAWIVKLPPAPAGEFQHAFIGAKIGRAKTRPNPEKPWIREVIPGKVYMGISQTPAWTAEQSYFLAETNDVPADADPQARVDGVGAAEWFWAEVPLSMVSFTAPNYVIVWSPSNYFTRASSAPILAAAEPDDTGARETRAWNNRSILGVPPRNAANSLETPINNIYPALALKLVPPGPDEPAVSVNDLSVARAGKRVVVRFSAAGEDVSDAWVEASRDRLDWERVSKLQRRPPFVFALPAEKSPAGLFLRGAARDVSGAIGYSDPYMVPYAARP